MRGPCWTTQGTYVYIPMTQTPEEHDTAPRHEHSTCRQRVPHSPQCNFFCSELPDMTLAIQAGNYSAHRMPQAPRLSVKGVASTGKSHHPLVTTSQRASHQITQITPLLVSWGCESRRNLFA